MVLSDPVRLVTSYSPVQFALVRIALGLYVLWYAAGFLPYGVEHFSAAGMLPDAQFNETFRVFPNVLTVVETGPVVMGWLGLLVGLSVLLIFGIARRPVALALWYGWACLFNRNTLTLNPSLHYVGWLLLACAIIPSGETLGLVGGRASQDWSMPRPLFWGAWLIMAAGYSVSGCLKLGSPSWMDGTAVWRVLDGPLAHPGAWRDLVLGWPQPVLQGLTWGTLALEVGFAPLCLWRPTRKLIWILTVVWLLGIILLTHLVFIGIGMLLIHLFTFDARWLASRGDRGRVGPRPLRDVPVLPHGT